ncbi:L,D-transpeptidase [Bifidobacterium sp.]|uniref:L,D-transpeptidase n=1 Tax=Bifidobacterium sp. TaxID=41200 RepID=UPI0025BE5CAC|nr:L,D-transpeptidase [Bifidobacterium sp.]MCH4209389.1 L,D-transpeptidase [Bifidobacterium sp.]MCI1224968.1 L,D-transpeptidase [Bifidobacterium sp.]
MRKIGDVLMRALRRIGRRGEFRARAHGAAPRAGSARSLATGAATAVLAIFFSCATFADAQAVALPMTETEAATAAFGAQAANSVMASAVTGSRHTRAAAVLHRAQVPIPGISGARVGAKVLIGAGSQQTRIPKMPGAHMSRPVDWHKPTGGAYPDIRKQSGVRIDVDLGAQRVHVLNGAGQIIYTMIASTGVHDGTPHGDYRIGARGGSFYNAKERAGANYWTAFIGTTYLFHTVPTDINGRYITSEAAKLGHPASHGCVRLSIADARWIHDAIPAGTPVHID